METVRIAIVEDDPVLREHLCRTVERVSGFEVGGVASNFAAGRALVAGQHDVLLVDLALPDGYLLKGADVEQTEKAIRDVIAGGAPISPAVAGHILARVRKAAVQVPATVPPGHSLTEKETEVLTELARGFSYKEVALRQGISHHTVADHVKSIYRKLSVNSRSQAVFEAMQSGLIELRN